MSIVLSKEILKPVFEDIVKAKDKNPALEQFAAVLKPVIKLTVERYPQNLQDDMGQELLMAIIKKADHIAEMFCTGKIENITNYVFRFLHNSAINYYRKENNYQTRFVSLEELGEVDVVAKTNDFRNQKLIDQIRIEVLDFCRARYKDPKEVAKAERFADVILRGKRPSFLNANITKFAKSKAGSAKEIYSAVMNKVRECVEEHYRELSE